MPCRTEEEAKSFLNEWRKCHHQARHVCYAYRFGVDKSKFRANDDGEPGNSAGAPILGQIQACDLTNVLIGVVRYFGGTKLGVGGLINAYRSAAKEALEQAVIIEKEIRSRFRLHFGYSAMNDVMNLLKRRGVDVVETNFGDTCMLTIDVPLKLSYVLKKDLESVEDVSVTDHGVE